MRSFLTTACLTASLLLCSLYVLARASGSLSGRITDRATGEPLAGVSIWLPGAHAGAVSDGKGSFQVAGLRAGTYTVVFKYLGYSDRQVAGVKVEAGETTILNIVLEKDKASRLNEIVVTSSYRQGSVNALYTDRKNSALVSDGISADQISRSPDNNTAEVLQRISGVNIREDKFVVVRGLTARYNSTMMNGTAMPATEPDRKAFSFDIIPSDLVDHIVIYKTASADHPGDAAGAAIAINTKDMPDHKLMNVSVGTGFNTRTTLKDFYSGYDKGKYDFLGFDEGRRALPAAFAAVQPGYAALSAAEKMEITRQFPNTFGGENSGASLPSLNVQLTAGNTYRMGSGHKLGVTASLTYGNGQKNLTGRQDQYLLSKEHIYHYQDAKYQSTNKTGALFNAAYIFGGNKLSWKNFFSNEFSAVFVRRTGQLYDGNDHTKQVLSINHETTQNGLLNSVLAGSHTLGGAVSLDWDIAYGLSYRRQPDQRILTVKQAAPGEPYYLTLSNENSPAIRDAGRVYSRLHENIYSGNVRVAVPFRYLDREQKLKFGLAKVRRSRSFSILALGYASDLDPYGRGATISLNKGESLSDIFSAGNLEQYKILLANIPQNTKDYTGNAGLNAGYVMLENSFSADWKLSWGLRLEDYHQQLVSVNQPVQQYHYTDLLPSANLTWSPNDKTKMRLAWSRTLNRPEFRELADFRYYDYEHDHIISGNPLLRRSINDNADWRLEYYPAMGEILSVSLFYKYFHHPIERINQGNSVLTYGNADEAVDYGLELELRKDLGFIKHWAPASSLSVYTNASFIRSRIGFKGKNYHNTLQGQSPYMINGGLDYTSGKKDLSFTLLYHVIGPRLAFRGEQEGMDAYEKSRHVLDFQVSKKVLKAAGEIRLTVSDILAQPTVLYYKYGGSETKYEPGRDEIISSFHAGTACSISFQYAFFH